jgi:hypothetical protein
VPAEPTPPPTWPSGAPGSPSGPNATGLERARQWALAEHWTRALDNSIRVPGTRLRFGWDAVIGLIPGVGDVAGLGLSLLVIVRGVLLGVGRWTTARLVVIALVDASIGTIPIAGEAFDFVYKANERNLRTIARHGVDPVATERQSRRIVLSTLAAVAITAVIALVVIVAAVVWLADRL